MNPPKKVGQQTASDSFLAVLRLTTGPKLWPCWSPSCWKSGFFTPELMTQKLPPGALQNDQLCVLEPDLLGFPDDRRRRLVHASGGTEARPLQQQQQQQQFTTGRPKFNILSTKIGWVSNLSGSCPYGTMKATKFGPPIPQYSQGTQPEFFENDWPQTFFFHAQVGTQAI